MNNRRTFLKSGLATTTALYLPSAWSRAVGANDAIRIGIIGCGGRGSSHFHEILDKVAGGCTDIRLTAICDPDTTHLDAFQSDLTKKSLKAERYTDFRKLLESPEVDAVIIATPNHTHSLIAAWALEHGKHVYVEKPVSHNLWEGRQLTLIAAKHEGKLICQHGMQRRNDPVWEKIRAYVESGKIGKPLLSRGLCYKKRDSIGKVGTPQTPPSTVDYDLWSGPREPEPIPRKNLHYDWHWQWQWGNGDIGNQGPHQLDVARWLIGDPTDGPSQVISIGGRFGYEDDATTANTQIAFFDFKPVPIIFEVRGLPDADMNFKGRLPSWKKTGVQVGNILHCEGGYIAEGIVYENGTDAVIDKTMRPNDGAGHQDAFFKHIREGKLPATHQVQTGHLAASLAHLANTSYRLGKSQPHGAIGEQIKGNALFSESYERFTEHLTKNQVALDKAAISLGAMLSFDGKTEQFTGPLAEQANAMNRGTYREAFSLPKV